MARLQTPGQELRGSGDGQAVAGSRAIILSLGLDTGTRRVSEQEAGWEETSVDRGAGGFLAGMASYPAAQV